jgi:hypothetical protein
MKRFLHFVLLGLITTLVACQKDEGGVSDTATTSSFTVTIPQREVPTRAVTDAFGTGMSVNRCILEIYHDGKLYNRIEKSVNNRTVTFDNLRLVAQQTYDFVFWADCADGSEGNFTDRHYNTQSLKTISNRGTFEGNSDERDAFFAKETFEVTGAFSKPVTLTRPFGLLVVKTNDLNEIKDEALKPTGYTVAFKNMPNTFNALTGEISGSEDISYTAEELAKDDGTISMDFLWATDTEAALSDFSMTFLNNSTEICTNDAFTNIPIRRNYKTNVSGNLLTKKGTINVTIDPEFEQPDITVVASADELIGALNDPNVTNISVASDIDLSMQSAEELTFSTYKAIEIKENKTIQLGNTNWLTAEEGLTLTGGGIIDNSSEDYSDLTVGANDHYQKSLIHITGGECVIEGVTLINDPDYHWHATTPDHPYNSAAIAYWNDANVTVKNAHIVSGEFAVCGMGRGGANTGKVILVDSYFESTSTNKNNGQHWAYAMRLFGSEVLIENCEVKGIQGAVSIEENAMAEIRSGKFYTVNTPGQKDAFYALYVSSGCEVTITGGEFIGANNWSALAEGTSAVVSGDNDAGRPSGNVILKGGQFSGKAYNHVTNTVYDPADGYKWQAIEDDPGLKWKVVAE